MVLATKKNCQRVLAAGLRVVSAMTGNPPLKPSSEHDRKHVLQLLRLYGDQALQTDSDVIYSLRIEYKAWTQETAQKT